MAKLLLAIFLHHKLRIGHAEIVLSERHATDHWRLLGMCSIVSHLNHVSSAAVAARIT